MTNAALANETDQETKAILEALETYVKDGGSVVFACQFSNLVQPPRMDVFWKNTFGLEWIMGNYHRTVVHVNSVAERAMKPITRLPAQYSQKAVFLQNVAIADALYLPDEDSRTQSMVFPSKTVDCTQTPTARARYHNGWVGYMGDVDAEAESDSVLLAMCGL